MEQERTSSGIEVTKRMVAEAFGRAIRERRLEIGMSQVELAAKVGVEQTAVSHWELGRVIPSDAIRPTIAKALRVGVYRLFRYPGQPEPTEGVPA